MQNLEKPVVKVFVAKGLKLMHDIWFELTRDPDYAICITTTSSPLPYANSIRACTERSALRHWQICRMNSIVMTTLDLG